MGPESVRLMRAIKELYPDVEAGKMVDPYIAACNAALDPDDPGYNAALRELLEAEVLRHSPEFDNLTTRVVNMNQHYEVTPEGARTIRDTA